MRNAVACGTIIIVLFFLGAEAGHPPPLPPPKRYDPPVRTYTEEDFDAVWIRWEDHTTFLGGEHVDYTVIRSLKILTHRGAERYFEVVIRYNQYWHELHVHYMRVVLPDGTVLSPPPEAVVDIPLVQPRVYSDARQRIYYLPGVAPGSLVEYSYTVRARFPIPGEFQDWTIFQDWMPIRLARYRLTLPPEYMMFVDWNVLQTNGIEELPVVFYTDGPSYIWEVERVPGIEPEYGMPSLWEVAPALVVSSLGSWEEVGNWWWGLVEELLRVPDPEVVKKAQEITRGLKGEMEMAAAIYHWVVRNIKYVALEFGIGGYKPLPPGQVLANMYGDCKDSMILLLAMLRALGIKAFPTLINVEGDVHPMLPSLWFDHAIAALPLAEEVHGSRWLFLDGTAFTNSFGDLPLGDQAKWALVVGIPDGRGGVRHELTQTPLFPPEHNRWLIRHEVTVEPDGTSLSTVTWECSGLFARYWRYVFLALTESQLNYLMASYANVLVPGANLLWYRIVNVLDYEKPLQVKLSFAAALGLFYAPGKMILRIPSLEPMRGLVPVKWRYYPLVIGAPYHIEHGTIVSLPTGFTLEALPPDLDLEYHWGVVRSEYRHTRFAGRTMIFHTVVYQINHKEVPRHLFNEYVEAQHIYARYLELPVLIRR